MRRIEDRHRHCTKHYFDIVKILQGVAQKKLIRLFGSSRLNQLEPVIIARMNSLAIREENNMVTRTTLSTLRQEQRKSVRTFGAKAKEQTEV